MSEILDWCSGWVGPCTVVSGDIRGHGRSEVCKLHAPSGHYYLKIHRQRPRWEGEVHAYEQWASAFGGLTPRLIAAHEQEPLALLVSELPGELMLHAQISAPQQVQAWRAAGRALAALHDLSTGEWFGPCLRSGAPAETPVGDAEAYVSRAFDHWTDRGIRAECLDKEELSIIRAARDLIPAFADERPVPCHRDYGPDNWLVTGDGVWAGTIDFELAYWDVRVADFSRYPNWEWMDRPELLAAFLDGYGRPLTPREEQQQLVAHVQYALSAISWGREHEYYGFEAEGRQALQHLSALLG